VVLDHADAHGTRKRSELRGLPRIGRDVAGPLDHRQVARCDPRVARHVDALDIDAGRDLPVHAHLPRADDVGRPAVQADDRDLSTARLDRREYVGRDVRPRRMKRRIAVRAELAAHDIVHFDAELAQRVEQPVAAGREHALQPAVAGQEAALAVVDRHAQHHQMPVHGTSPSFAARQGRAAELRRARAPKSRIWVPDASSRKHGGPRLEPGQCRAHACGRRA
jgi:hypothetical protein